MILEFFLAVERYVEILKSLSCQDIDSNLLSTCYAAHAIHAGL